MLPSSPRYAPNAIRPSSSIATLSEKRRIMLPLGTRSPVPTSQRSSRGPATKLAPGAGALKEWRGDASDAAVVNVRTANLVDGAADPKQPVTFRRHALQAL